MQSPVQSPAMTKNDGTMSGTSVFLGEQTSTLQVVFLRLLDSFLCEGCMDGSLDGLDGDDG